MTSQYLRTYFAEAQPENRRWVFEANGNIHSMSTDRVIEIILNEAAPSEQEQIASTVRRIDFLNGSIHHYLMFLGEAYAANNF